MARKLPPQTWRELVRRALLRTGFVFSHEAYGPVYCYVGSDSRGVDALRALGYVPLLGDYPRWLGEIIPVGLVAGYLWIPAVIRDGPSARGYAAHVGELSVADGEALVTLWRLGGEAAVREWASARWRDGAFAP